MSTPRITDPGQTLGRIVEARRRRVREAKSAIAVRELKSRIADLEPARGFRAALSPPKPDVTVIAELKKASPSRGLIRADFNPVELARCLAENGARALSVLTEPDFFLGAPASLGQVRAAVDLPLLRKDFIVDPYQVYESRVLGADALLIIVRILTRSELTDLMGIVRDAGLECLVEVNTEQEIETALDAGARLIGINNRNLETLVVDRETAMRLGRLVGNGAVAVAMSGIRSRADIDVCVGGGIRSFLVGTTLMQIPDIGDMGRALRLMAGNGDEQ